MVPGDSTEPAQGTTSRAGRMILDITDVNEYRAQVLGVPPVRTGPHRAGHHALSHHHRGRRLLRCCSRLHQQRRQRKGHPPRGPQTGTLALPGVRVTIRFLQGARQPGQSAKGQGDQHGQQRPVRDGPHALEAGIVHIMDHDRPGEDRRNPITPPTLRNTSSPD